jgi:hypothetical protein
MVKEVRKVKLLQNNIIKISNLPTCIEPTSISISPGNIMQQSYEYDLIDFSRMLDKYTGKLICITVNSEKTLTGYLLGFDTHWIFLRDKLTNNIELIAKKDISHISLPGAKKEDIMVTPTLVCKVATGYRLPDERIMLSYITSGITWRCDYTGIIDIDETCMEFSAKVTIDNKSGGVYPDARIKLVAGSPYKISEPSLPPYRRYKRLSANLAQEEHREKAIFATKERIGEYYLYTVEEPATIKNNQITQLVFIPQCDVPIKMIFRYEYTKSEKNARVILCFTNNEEYNLGIPLPKGKIRFYKEDKDGFLQFIGENIIEHTSTSKTVEMYIGDAFDISGKRIMKDRRILSRNKVEEDYEITLQNAKDKTVSVEVVERVWGSWRVVRASHKYIKKDANTLVFNVDVLPYKETVVSYTIVYKR